MYSAISKERVQEILNFISQITLGNYTYRLPLKDQKDELEQIVAALTTMVEEIDTVVHQINHEKSKTLVQRLYFFLDENFLIKFYSDSVEKILHYSDVELRGTSINNLLLDINGNPIEITKDILEINKFLRSNSIALKNKEGMIWTGKAHLNKFNNSGDLRYGFSFWKLAYYNEFSRNPIRENKISLNKYPSRNRSLLLRDQRELKNELHKFVMNRLDRNLPTLDAISLEIGASKSKIRKVFQRGFEESMHAYHLRKRLEKAHTLIVETLLPINEIAEECGFISFPHFTRKFKKQYGVTPTECRKI